MTEREGRQSHAHNHRTGGKARAGKDSQRRRTLRRNRAKANGRIVRRPALPREQRTQGFHLAKIMQE